MVAIMELLQSQFAASFRACGAQWCSWSSGQWHLSTEQSEGGACVTFLLHRARYADIHGAMDWCAQARAVQKKAAL